MIEGHVVHLRPKYYHVIERGLQEGARRTMNALLKNAFGATSGGHFTYADKYGIVQHSIGALAESLMAEALEVEWDPIGNDFNRLHDVGGYEVRGVDSENGELKVRPDNERLYLRKKYALIVVRSIVEYRVVGWTTGAEVDAMLLEREDRGQRNLPAWFVPQNRLHEPDGSVFEKFKSPELKDAIRKMADDIVTRRKR